VWYVKEPSLLKAVSAKYRSKFAALFTGNGDSRQIAEQLLVRLKITKQNFTNGYIMQMIMEYRYIVLWIGDREAEVDLL
jgi:hypothetical protein